MRSAWAWMAAALLPGCAALPSPEDVAAVRPLDRSATTAFRLEGRLAIRQGENRHHVRVSWQHEADADVMLIASPLGQGIAELTRDRHGAHLLTSDRRSFAAPDLETLSEEVFGFRMPLAGLPRWLLADLPPTAVDRFGRPLAARAGDWLIAYLDYESESAGALPLLMEFRRGDLEIRLKVDAWDLSP